MSTRIQDTFKKADSKKVMSLFLTAGYPTIEDTVNLVLTCVESGADMIELGMPFSDPLADGPTIQESSNVAIENGVNLPIIFDMVKQIRQKSEIPIILMGYINPIISFGIEAFCQEASRAGVDGLIIPDMPIDEQDILVSHSRRLGLSMIHLVAPNTTDDRMKLVDENSDGFVYCVSVTGVTGARDGNTVSESVDTFIDRVKRNITRNPVLVGFGIKSREDALRISNKTDGYIVGSALIQAIKDAHPHQDWLQNVGLFVKNLR
jgi:tryptophan synthase alpha chain